MRDIVIALICVAGVLLVGYVANRANRKIFPGRPKTTLRNVMITSLAIACGLAAGLVLIPVFMIPENPYGHVASAVGIVIVLGKLELVVLRRAFSNALSAYILDNNIFPFGSLGFAVAFMLKPYLAAGSEWAWFSLPLLVQ